VSKLIIKSTFWRALILLIVINSAFYFLPYFHFYFRSIPLIRYINNLFYRFPYQFAYSDTDNKFYFFKFGSDKIKYYDENKKYIGTTDDFQREKKIIWPNNIARLSSSKNSYTGTIKSINSFKIYNDEYFKIQNNYDNENEFLRYYFHEDKIYEIYNLEDDDSFPYGYFGINGFTRNAADSIPFPDSGYFKSPDFYSFFKNFFVDSSSVYLIDFDILTINKIISFDSPSIYRFHSITNDYERKLGYYIFHNENSNELLFYDSSFIKSGRIIIELDKNYKDVWINAFLNSKNEIIILNSYVNDNESYNRIFFYNNKFEKVYEKKVDDFSEVNIFFKPNLITALSIQPGIIPPVLFFYADNYKLYVKNILYPVDKQTFFIIIIIQLIFAIMQFVLIYKYHLKCRSRSIAFKCYVFIGFVLFPYSMLPVYFLYKKWERLKK